MSLIKAFVDGYQRGLTGTEVARLLAKDINAARAELMWRVGTCSNAQLDDFDNGLWLAHKNSFGFSTRRHAAELLQIFRDMRGVSY